MPSEVMVVVYIYRMNTKEKLDGGAKTIAIGCQFIQCLLLICSLQPERGDDFVDVASGSPFLFFFSKYSDILYVDLIFLLWYNYKTLTKQTISLRK